MAAKLLLPILLLVQVMPPVRTQNKIEPIAPIAGTERSSLNITCMVTITSDLEGVKLKKLGAGGKDQTLVQLIAPDYKLNDDFDTTKYTFVNMGLPSFTVTIKEAMFVDAERYRCELIVDNNVNQVTTVVMMRQPTIQVLSQIRAGDTTKMSCDVEYEVPYDLDGTNEADRFPKLVATIGGVEQSGAVVERTKGKLAMSWNATLSAEDDKKDLVCKASTDATPYYEISTTEALNVLYDVQDIQLAPQQESYYVGDMINCTAQGNPAPTIRWIAINTKTPGENVGSGLSITETMVGETKEEWKCEATSTLSGKRIEVAIEFSVVSTPTTSTTTTSPGFGVTIIPGESEIRRPVKSSLELECLVSGLPEDTIAGISWFTTTGEVSTNMGRVFVKETSVNTKKLYILDIEIGDQGTYWCVASANRRQVHRSTGLSVYKDITFDLAPPLQYPWSGTSALVVCKTSGFPPPSVWWRRHGKNIIPGGRYAYEPKGLRIYNITITDTGLYTCVAEVSIEGRVKEKLISVIVR